MTDSPIIFPPWPRDPNSIRGRAYAEHLAECGTPERAKLYADNQGDLAEAVADLLDNALHLEGCYITPDETTCVCLIGKLRALLPLCAQPRTQGGYFDGEATYWRCVRHIHPSAPDAHVFGQV
jgi:hypothetical protein